MNRDYIGVLVGDTGGTQIKVALKDSFSVRRGEFVRVRHQELRDRAETWVLGRITRVGRYNVLFQELAGDSAAEIRPLVTAGMGETCFALMEIIGFRDPDTHEVKLPRRPLDPGSKVHPVDEEFLREFYQFQPDSSINLGCLVGYERGASAVPIYLDVNRLATEHMAVLAMTGAGKSYLVGRVIEQLLLEANCSVLVLDPHGEYSAALSGGQLNLSDLSAIDDDTQRRQLERVQQKLLELQTRGGGVKVYCPGAPAFTRKYGGQHHKLSLRLDSLSVDEFEALFPDMTEAQSRLLHAALRYWKEKLPQAQRDPNSLLRLLTDGLDQLRSWDAIPAPEAKSFNERSASIIAVRIRNLLADAKGAFYEQGDTPFNIRDVVGRQKPSSETDTLGCVAVVDMAGMSLTAAQSISAIVLNDVLAAIMDQTDPIRPVMVVVEEAHNFCPGRGEKAISLPIIKKLAAEGRKFGVGLIIVSQRPSKLDADVTSQCNTLVTMRIKNPDDQKFVERTSEYLSRVDLDELPALSTGEALVSGRAIIAPLLCRVGLKVLKHGGQSPEVSRLWRQNS